MKTRTRMLCLILVVSLFVGCCNFASATTEDYFAEERAWVDMDSTSSQDTTYIYLHQANGRYYVPTFVTNFANSSFAEGGLYLLNLETTTYTLLSEGVSEYDVIGEYIVYATHNGLYSVPKSGGNAERVCALPENDGVEYLYANTDVFFFLIGNTMYRYRVASKTLDSIVLSGNGVAYMYPVSNYVVMWSTVVESTKDDIEPEYDTHYCDFSTMTSDIGDEYEFEDNICVLSNEASTHSTATSSIESGIIPLMGVPDSLYNPTFYYESGSFFNGSLDHNSACTCHKTGVCEDNLPGCQCNHVTAKLGNRDSSSFCQCAGFALHAYFMAHNIDDSLCGVIPAANFNEINRTMTSSNDYRDLIENLCTGSVLRLHVKQNSFNHSIIISSYDNSSVSFWEANYDGKCKVGYRTRTYAQLFNQYDILVNTSSTGHAAPVSAGASGHRLCGNKGCPDYALQPHYAQIPGAHATCLVCGYTGNISIGINESGDFAE